MKLSNKEIKEIAENLDCGMICYVNKITKEIKSIIDSDDFYDDDGLWQEELDEIENNWDSYVKIEQMPSRGAFQIMEDFTNQVSNKEIRNRLVYALNRNKPFKNFKYEVDYNEEVRQHWFKFKAYKYEEWVKDFLDNLSEENDEDLEINPPKIMGYYNDDGSEYNPDLVPLPSLCMSCKKKDDPKEEMLCNLTRMDQLGEPKFICFAYESLNQNDNE